MSIKGYNLYKKGSKVYLSDPQTDEIPINVEEITNLNDLKTKLEKLGEDLVNKTTVVANAGLSATTAEKEAVDEARKKIMQVLYYYREIRNIDDALLNELSLYAGIKTYDANAIQKFYDGIKTIVFPKFFKKYPDIIDYTKDHWEAWKKEIVEKYFKNGINDLQGFNPKKIEKVKIKEAYERLDIYCESNNKEKFWKKLYQLYLYHPVYKNAKHFAEGKYQINDYDVTNVEIDKFNDVLEENEKKQKHNKTNIRFELDPSGTYKATGQLELFFDYDHTKQEIIQKDGHFHEGDYKKSVVKITIDFDKPRGDKPTITVGYTEPYVNLQKFIENTLDQCREDYEKQNKLKLDDYQPIYDGKRRRKRS